MNVLAFGASSSKNSINKKFASYAAHLIPNAEIRVLDLNDYEIPLFSVDREKEIGQAKEAIAFIAQLDWADVIVISFAEHNGNYTAAFKNLFDWVSRVKLKMFESKKCILLSASNGPRGGQTSLNIAVERLPRHGAEIIGSLSLPLYKDNFTEEEGLINPEIKRELIQILDRI